MGAKKINNQWDGERIPPEMWGKDHFSTLIYIESRIVDQDGQPVAEHMRTKPGGIRRGKVRGNASTMPPKDYPTVLQAGVKLYGHDDWDCVDDLEAAGYVDSHGTGLLPTYQLTDKGWELAHRVRRHLGDRPSGKRTINGLAV